MSTIQSFKPMYKATPLMRELIERTGPKLPAITNKNLTVLPWDWELPSTILKSEWAKQHKQCRQAFVKGVINNGKPEAISFCGSGLLLHYYGYTGDKGYNAACYRLYGRAFSDRHRLLEPDFVSMFRIPFMNDRLEYTYEEIGSCLSRDGF